MDRCSARVSDGWRDHQCSRIAKIKQEDKWYCGTHNPVRIKEKRESKLEKWSKEQAVRQSDWDRVKAMRQYFDGVSTERIQRLIVMGIKYAD